jgi:hypothetical protein
MVLVPLVLMFLAGCYPVPLPPAASGGTPAITIALPATPTLVPPPATPEAAATIVSLTAPQTQGSFASPDDRWRAEIVVYPCVETGEGKMAFEELRLLDTRDESAVLVDQQLRNCEGLGAFGLAGRFWSPDSRYFYYTDAREGQPDGGCVPWIPPTLRFDTQTHESLRLGNGPLSPDRTRLAAWQDPELVVWNLETGEAARVRARVTDVYPGQIAWSPDGESLAYLQTDSMCPPSGAAYITRVNLDDLSQEALLDADETGFMGLAWENGSALRLTTADNETWRLDVASRELTPIE